MSAPLAGSRLHLKIRAITDNGPGWVELADLQPGQHTVDPDGHGITRIRAIHTAVVPVFEIHLPMRNTKKVPPSARWLAETTAIPVAAGQQLLLEYPGGKFAPGGLLLTAAELIQQHSLTPSILLPATALSKQQNMRLTENCYVPISHITPRGLRTCIWIELDASTDNSFVIARNGVVLLANGLPAAPAPVLVEDLTRDHAIPAGAQSDPASASFTAALLEGIDDALAGTEDEILRAASIAAGRPDVGRRRLGGPRSTRPAVVRGLAANSPEERRLSHD